MIRAGCFQQAGLNRASVAERHRGIVAHKTIGPDARSGSLSCAESDVLGEERSAEAKVTECRTTLRTL